MSTKVLVFESDPAFAAELRRELSKLGCSTSVVDDSNAGLQAAAADKPDLILLSVELPRVNGFSVCNKLKKDSKLQEVPLIIMSTESSDETFEQHRKLRTRAEDYIHKPIAFPELLAHISRFVKLEAPPMKGSSWQALRSVARNVGDVRSLTLTMSIVCDHCALAVPVNGPTQLAHCPHCSKEMPVAHLCEVLAFAAGSVKMGTPDGWRCSYSRFDEASAECAGCGERASVAPYLAKGDSVGLEDLDVVDLDAGDSATTIPCARCGAGMPAFPAPDWLKEHLPTALRVFGGDAEVARAEGINLAMNEAASKPIAMPCPSCGGGLTIKHDTDRTITCEFCSTSVFIPDALWKRLHPIKTMLQWTLTYTGKLSTDKLENARSLAKATVSMIRSRGKNVAAEIRSGRKIFLVDTEGWFVKVFDEEAAALLPSAPLPAAKRRKLPMGIVLAVTTVAIVATVIAVIALR